MLSGGWIPFIENKTTSKFQSFAASNVSNFQSSKVSKLQKPFPAFLIDVSVHVFTDIFKMRVQ